MLGRSKFFTAKNLKKYPKVKGASAQKFIVPLNRAMAKYSINSCYEKAHFLAQTFHEADHYKTTEEYASGRAYEGRKDLGNIKSGDGVRYKGRGLIQLTGRTNYTSYGFASNPVAVASNLYSAIYASGFYWTKIAQGGTRKGCAGKYKNNINNLINKEPNNVYKVTRCVNGGNRGLSERKRLFKKIKKEWGLK